MMRMRLIPLIALFALASELSAASQLRVDLVRVNEERYERFRNEDGAVYVPATIYSSEGKFAETLCAGQVKDQEISVIKDDMDPSEVSMKETKILKRLIDRCQILEAKGTIPKLEHS
jgi:hypothetical protein